MPGFRSYLKCDTCRGLQILLQLRVGAVEDDGSMFAIFSSRLLRGASEFRVERTRRAARWTFNFGV